jgi:hypothetical protein
MEIVTHPSGVLKNIIAIAPPFSIFPSQNAQLDNNAPPGLLLISEYLSAQTCSHIREYSDEQLTDRATSCAIDGMVFPLLSIFTDVYCNRVAPFYKADIEWYERPRIMRHMVLQPSEQRVDAEIQDTDGQWQRSQSRDYSTLLFLNDDFEGGQLHLVSQNYSIIPKAGMLVAFPSDHRFMYTDLPITSGSRYELSSWGAAMGTTRPTQKPADAMFLRQQYALSQFGSAKI